jgi:superfamily II DNA or RNA helicase
VDCTQENVKLIGLTATPFRTSESEAGLLAQIYRDGVNEKDQVVKNDLGITYQIGLKDLINNRILSKPIFESNFTDEDYGEALGLDALERIQYLDVIPDELADRMAKSAVRNKLIVDTCLKKAKEYGQTIVFAVSIPHAIVLSKLFHKAGVTNVVCRVWSGGRIS